jgi:anti-sigma B factor antagonist
MGLEIGQREKETVVVLDLEGRITAGEEAAALREKIKELATSGKPNVVLNMKQVDYVDSTGLGAMVMCHTATNRAGGAIKLLDLNERNIELLVLTKLTTVFDIFTEEQQAVNSFFPNREVRKFDVLEFVRRQKEQQE